MLILCFKCSVFVLHILVICNTRANNYFLHTNYVQICSVAHNFHLFSWYSKLFFYFQIDFSQSKRIPNSGCQPHELCEQVKNYPLKEITRMLKKNKRFNLLSGSVVEPVKTKVFLEPQLKHIDESYQEENMCRTKKVTVLPRIGIGRRKSFFIVNTPEFHQTVEYETCV